jgi:Protein of unknown function (DUF2530)
MVVTADSLAYVPQPANPSPVKSSRLRPSPPPREVDTFALVAVGTGLWALALLVLLFFRDGHGLWLQTCAAGFGLGLLGLVASRHRRG